MKNKKFFLTNILLALFVILIMILFVTVLKLVKSPGGIAMFVIMLVISLGALAWFTYYSSFREVVPESVLMLALPTYAFQLTPFAIYFLSIDSFVKSSLVMIPIVLMAIFAIVYVVVIFALTHYNKKAVVADQMTAATVIAVQDEKEYYNEDGTFKKGRK